MRIARQVASSAKAEPAPATTAMTLSAPQRIALVFMSVSPVLSPLALRAHRKSFTSQCIQSFSPRPPEIRRQAIRLRLSTVGNNSGTLWLRSPKGSNGNSRPMPKQPEHLRRTEMSAEYTSDTARTQQTSSTMKDLKDQAGSQANRLAEGVKDEVSRRSDEMRGSLAERVDNLASAFRSAKSEVGEESPFARMFDYAAENAEGFADTLEGANVVDSVREFARERPGTFLGISAVAGFAAARFLLAGKPGRTYRG
ncbi:MAG: hypothetical protein ACU0DM_13455, partial [Paracoccus sp. (in: a-proteobacteria)]